MALFTSKRGFWLLSLLLLGILAGYFFSGDSVDAPKSESTPIVATRLIKKEIYDSVNALGTASANESIDITANATEKISSIEFEDGQQVKKGDVIVVLEQHEEQAQLKAAQVQLAEHKRELSRLKSLIAQKAASKREYDERKTLIGIAEQEAKEIQARIEERTLRAPFDGVVGLRRLSVGGLVMPGEIITTLDDVDPIKLNFNVPDVYLSSLSTGMPIEAKSSSLGKNTFMGTIAKVDTRVDPVTRSVVVRALIPNENGHISPGVLMQVDLIKNKRKAIIAPEEAVFQKQEDHFVWAIDENTMTVSQQKVQVGVRRPGIIEIASGLDAGALIVLRGIDHVREGQKISIQPAIDARSKPSNKEVQ
jgi:membrane fusion protein (multidrug efflux system)